MKLAIKLGFYYSILACNFLLSVSSAVKTNTEMKEETSCSSERDEECELPEMSEPNQSNEDDSKRASNASSSGDQAEKDENELISRLSHMSTCENTSNNENPSSTSTPPRVISTNECSSQKKRPPSSGESFSLTGSRIPPSSNFQQSQHSFYDLFLDAMRRALIYQIFSEAYQGFQERSNNHQEPRAPDREQMGPLETPYRGLYTQPNVLKSNLTYKRHGSDGDIPKSMSTLFSEDFGTERSNEE